MFLIGDLNGRIGCKVNVPVVGSYGEATVNNNGERLIEMCEKHSLKIVNGWFKRKNIHPYVWVEPTRKLISIIDYVILGQRSRLRILDVKAMRGPECGKDQEIC